MSILNIAEMRLTLAWTETTAALLTGGLPAAPMAFLGAPAKYQARWKEMAQRLGAIALNQTPPGAPSGGRELEPPARWRNLGQHYSDHFWWFYSGQQNLLDAHASAWPYLLPFRETFPVQKTGQDEAAAPITRVAAYGLYYPHGCAAVVTLYLRFDANGKTGAGLELMMSHALSAPHSGFSLADGQGGPDVRGVATAILATLRQRALGSQAPDGKPTDNPIVTATIVRGSGVDADVKVGAGSLLHKALAGLCRQTDQWQYLVNLPTPDQANLLLGPHPAGHVVYHTPMGRVAWLPGYFTAPPGRAEHRLACYHNNLANATLQTDMLARLVSLYMAQAASAKKPHAAFKALARAACERLVDLYAAAVVQGSKATYNSASPRAYLDDNGFLKTLQAACQSFSPPVPPPTYTSRP
jgi:hypothetical protein